MPVPKRKLSRKRRDQRSANKHIVPLSHKICPTNDCGAAIFSHRACYKCGKYKGEQIIPIKMKKAEATKEMQA